jgi:hypothetical protein
MMLLVADAILPSFDIEDFLLNPLDDLWWVMSIREVGEHFAVTINPSPGRRLIPSAALDLMSFHDVAARDSIIMKADGKLNELAEHSRAKCERNEKLQPVDAPGSESEFIIALAAFGTLWQQRQLAQCLSLCISAASTSETPNNELMSLRRATSGPPASIIWLFELVNHVKSNLAAWCAEKFQSSID